MADKVLVPLQPSVFDIFATRAFLDELAEHRKHAQDAGGAGGHAGGCAHHRLRQAAGVRRQPGVPVLGYLRDTQNYVHLAAHGLTLFDVAPGRVEKDLEQWQPICAGWTTDAPDGAPAHWSSHENLSNPGRVVRLVGQEVAVSDWITVTQEQVNLFAQATGDHQWIHVDVERAKAGPFGAPIAHGLLTCR
jgi:hypothetical protein